MPMPEDRPSPLAPITDEYHLLQQLRVGAQMHVGAHVVHHMRAEQLRDYVTDSLVYRLTSEVLAEALPPQRCTHVVEWTVPRLASWVDVLVATYRGRWWARLLRLHRRELRYVDEPIRHEVEVVVRDHWTYPQSDRVLPELGPHVLRTFTDVHDRYRW
jgi:hypothetical protein